MLWKQRLKTEGRSRHASTPKLFGCSSNCIQLVWSQLPKSLEKYEGKYLSLAHTHTQKMPKVAIYHCSKLDNMRPNSIFPKCTSLCLFLSIHDLFSKWLVPERTYYGLKLFASGTGDKHYKSSHRFPCTQNLCPCQVCSLSSWKKNGFALA